MNKERLAKMLLQLDIVVIDVEEPFYCSWQLEVSVKLAEDLQSTKHHLAPALSCKFDDKTHVRQIVFSEWGFLRQVRNASIEPLIDPWLKGALFRVPIPHLDAQIA